MKNIWIFILIVFSTSYAFAGASDGSEVFEKGNKILEKETEIRKNTFEDAILMNCEKTPAIEHDYLSTKPVRRNNNLIRKPGSALRAHGKFIEIQGKIVDEDCVPITDAVIKIWQSDNAGNYQDFYDLKSSWDVRDENYDPNFGYSGTALSDNLGMFRFLTIFPNSNDQERAPHLNVLIKHDDFGELKTKMFFNKNPKNKNDKSYSILTPKQQSLVKAYGTELDDSGNLEGRIYSFLITLEGINKYREF